MQSNASETGRSWLMVGCFDFVDADTGGEGTFQILVAARDLADAAARCRARLDAIATSTTLFGPVLVYVNAFVDAASASLGAGLLINHQTLGDVQTYDYLPDQELVGDELFGLEDVEDQTGTALELAAGAAREVPPFWSGVALYRAKWKLFWCTTSDGAEDWFVVARSEAEAATLHEDEEGYVPGDAHTEFVCVLPASEQSTARRARAGWPSDDTLRACGAEFLAEARPDDPRGALLRRAGHGGRVVRLDGRVYVEGQLVSGDLPASSPLPANT